MAKNYIKPFDMGVLEMVGLYAEGAIPEEHLEALEMGVWDEYHFTLQSNGAPNWQCWQPLVCHGNEIIEETGGKLVCIFGTRNCACNISGPEVRAVLNCLFDGALSN